MKYQPQRRSDIQPDYWDVRHWHEAVLRKIMGQSIAALNVLPIDAVFDGTFYKGGEDD